MSQRPRRSVARVNYEQLANIGIIHHSPVENRNDSSDEEDAFDKEVSEDDILESESDSEEEGDVDNNINDSVILNGSDGTNWTTRIPRAPIPGWRNGLRNYHDGPTQAALPIDGVIQPCNEIFSLMISDDTIQDICNWTNEYGHWRAEQLNAENEEAITRKVWRDVTVIELKAFVGLVILGGVLKAKHTPWSDMWIKDERIKSHPFSATMSKTRFYNLMSTLRFDNVQERRLRRQAAVRNNLPLEDKLEPIRNVASTIISTFSSLYTPGAFVTVDEQLIKFRGRCPFKVYLKSKPGRYGVKVWALADTASRFVINLQIYTGKTGNVPEVNQGKRVVLDLVQPIQNTQRGVVADNFFTSINLVQELLDIDLSYCGTIRKCRKEIPPSLRNVVGIPVNTTTFLFHEDTFSTLVRHVPHKNAYFLLLSSSHYDNSMVELDKGRISEINHHYNTMKFGVDTVDQMLAFYSAQFPSRRWPMKVFIHLVEVAALNAFVIDKRNHETMGLVAKQHRFFLQDLGFKLIHPYIQQRAASVPNLHNHIKESIRKMKVKIPADTRAEDNVNNADDEVTAKPKQKRCKLCSTEVKKQRQSQRQCEQCGQHVCAQHSKRSYKCNYCLENPRS